MKTIFALLAAALLCGCGKTDKPKSAREKLLDQARQLFGAEITNSIVGLRSVNRFWLEDFSESATNWRGVAEVEFINHRGGVARTNLVRVFRWHKFDLDPAPTLLCEPDYDAEAKAEWDDFQRRLAKAGK